MILQGLAGIAVFTILAWLMSENRSSVSIRIIVTGISMQFVLGIILLKLPLSRDFFIWLNQVVLALESATTAGTSFVFGYLGGGPLPFESRLPGASFILAFRALPLVLVISALSALLFYWKILPIVVKTFSFCLKKTMGIGGAEGLGVAANIFVGMVESPLFIRPYLAGMSRSELFTIMVAGMATIAGTVMVLYASILRDVMPDVMGHILTASIISAPSAVMISKIMIPQSGKTTEGEVAIDTEMANSMDAVTRGTLEGVKLLLNIVAMLIVLVALVHLVNQIFSLIPEVGNAPVTLQRVFGWFMAPMAWLMGIGWDEAQTCGMLMGTKTILNEFIAYLELGKLAPDTLSPRSTMIITYAMCGFANPGSLGIMIGGMGTMAPARREEIVSLGFRSIIAGTLATMMTGAVVGILVSK